MKRIITKIYSIGKNTKKPYSRGKSFGYQVLGFGSGVNSAIAHRAVWAGAFRWANFCFSWY